VQVKSEVGQGSTFTLVFPLRAAGAFGRAAQPQARSAAG
jgi:hypothetical protein